MERFTGWENIIMTNSSWENYFEIQIQEAGLPKPVREYKFLKNRRFRLDFAWPLFNLGFEIDGGIFGRGRHVNPIGFTRDHQKFALAMLDGWKILRATSGQISSGEGIEWLKEYFQKIKDRFEKKIIKKDGCWEWVGSKDGRGYGMFGICTCPNASKIIRAHRVSYIFYNKTVKDGNHILHSCDNPECVNPEHLREGTHQDNMDDRDSRGRGVQLCKFKKGNPGKKGSDNPQSKLTDEQVEEIRALLEKGELKHKEIAEIFGVTRPTITAIKNGRIRKKT